MTACRESDRDRAARFVRMLEAQPTPRPVPAGDQWLAIRLRLAAERRKRALLPLRWVAGVAVAAVMAAAVGLLFASSSASAMLPQALASETAAPVWLGLSVGGLLLPALLIVGLVLWQFGESWVEP